MRIHSLDIREKKRTSMDVGLSTQRIQTWKEMVEPKWAHIHYPPINFQDLYYYSAPKNQEAVEQFR